MTPPAPWHAGARCTPSIRGVAYHGHALATLGGAGGVVAYPDEPQAPAADGSADGLARCDGGAGPPACRRRSPQKASSQEPARAVDGARPGLPCAPRSRRREPSVSRPARQGMRPRGQRGSTPWRHASHPRTRQWTRPTTVTPSAPSGRPKGSRRSSYRQATVLR